MFRLTFKKPKLSSTQAAPEVDKFTFRKAHEAVSTGVDANAKYLYRQRTKDTPTSGRYKTFSSKRGVLVKLFNRKHIQTTTTDFKAAALQLYHGQDNPEVYPSIAYFLTIKDATKLGKMGKYHLGVLGAEEARRYAPTAPPPVSPRARLKHVDAGAVATPRTLRQHPSFNEDRKPTRLSKMVSSPEQLANELADLENFL